MPTHWLYIGTLSANSEAVGEIFILLMCSYPVLCVVKEEKKNKLRRIISGLGTRTGSTLAFVLYYRTVLRHKTNDETTYFRLLVRLQ